MANGGVASVGGPAGFGSEPLQLSWKQESGLIGLSIINFILRVLTLGIYHFWGKTEVRRRIWSAVRLNGEPLEYTGTGKELFLGFLVVLGFVLVPIILISVAAVFIFGPESAALSAVQVLLYLVIFFLLGIGIHRALRYRLARTRWRGIRGGLEGSSLGFAWTHFWTALLIPFTLGWIMPWRATKLQAKLYNSMRFGDRPFRFTARSGPLLGRFAVVWVCSVILFLGLGAVIGYVQYTALANAPLGGPPARPSPELAGLIVLAMVATYLIFGIMLAWYQAAVFNHFAAHTEFEGARFRANLTAWSMIWLILSNLLIVGLTLGLLAPVAQARGARYLVQRLRIDGAVPMADIAQRAEDPMKRGEGLAQMFDVDAF